MPSNQAQAVNPPVPTPSRSIIHWRGQDFNLDVCFPQTMAEIEADIRAFLADSAQIPATSYLYPAVQAAMSEAQTALDGLTGQKTKPRKDRALAALVELLTGRGLPSPEADLAARRQVLKLMLDDAAQDSELKAACRLLGLLETEIELARQQAG